MLSFEPYGLFPEPHGCEKKRCGDRETDDIEDENSELFGAAAGRRFCDDEVQSPAETGSEESKIGQPDERLPGSMTHIPPLYRDRMRTVLASQININTVRMSCKREALYSLHFHCQAFQPI